MATHSSKALWRQMRPPSARPMRVHAPFSGESSPCPGLVLTLAENEPAVCAASGEVAQVTRIAAAWPSALPPHNHPLWRVNVYHGDGVYSNVLGLGTVQVAPRQTVARGDVLGVPYNREILFQVVDNHRVINPAHINRHFDAYSEPRLPTLRGWLRQAPDRVQRVFASVESIILAGVRQFNREPCDLLVNVAFNGNGTVEGAAVLGADGDYWNNVMPDYTVSPGGYCTLNGTWQLISGQMVVQLREATGDLSAIHLVKEHGFTVGGTGGATWSDLLNRWIGAAPIGAGADNIFSLRGLPSGLLTIHAYGQGQSGAQAGLLVNGVQVMSRSLTANPGAFVSGSNYVVLSAVLAQGDNVMVRMIGKASGLQIFSPAQVRL